MNTFQQRYMQHLNAISMKLNQIKNFDKVELTAQEIEDLRQSFAINQIRLKKGINAFKNPLRK